uniref:Bet v I/Major latex protein domain-containing protein n=1 Tax=Leersia perrieri TaxID=77586 RepID=A0A0D9XB58_9ORYZ
MALETAAGEEAGRPASLGTEKQGGGQCSSTVVMRIKAPVHLVWSIVRRFDEPHIFQPFVRGCKIHGSVAVGCVREVDFKSSFPAKSNVEKLEILDDKEHIISIRIIGGDLRLKNYSSILTANPEVIDGQPATLVTKSFVVDVPQGNTADETRHFVEFLMQCNLRSLALVSERLLAQRDLNEPPAQ